MRFVRLPVTEKSFALLVFPFLFLACTIDSTGSTDVTLSVSIPEPHFTVFSSDIDVNDAGAYPSIGSTAFSRCPDQQVIGQPHVYLMGRTFDVSVPNPDDNDALVHFSIPSDAVRFMNYLQTGATISRALYRIGQDVVSNGNAKWIARKDVAVSIMRCSGVLPGTAARYKTANNIVVYVGRLRLESLEPIDKSGLGDDPSPPPSSCDDPLTEEVETECQPGGPMVSGDGGGYLPEQSQWGAPAGGGSNWSLVCDVTYWYESWDGGQTGFYTGEYTIHWDTCTIS